MSTDGKNPIDVMNEELAKLNASSTASEGKEETDVVEQTEENTSEETTSATEQENDVEVTEEKSEETETKDKEENPEDKKQNAFKAISEKLKVAKQEAADAKAGEEKLLERFAKLMKMDKDTIKSALEKEEAEADGLTPEAAKRIKDMEEKLNSFQSKDNDAKWETGINNLIELGASEEDITSFIKSQREAGNDFVSKPNPDLMVKLFKVENADKLIQLEVQKQLKAKKTVVVDNSSKSTNVKTNKNDDAFLSAMVAIAKNK